MSFKGAVVLSGMTIVVKYPGSLEVSDHLNSIISQLNPKTPRLSAERGSLQFTTITDNDGLTVIGITDTDIDIQARNRFINDIQREWRLKYGASAPSFAQFSKSEEFGPTIDSIIKSYNNNAQLKVARSNIEDAQQEMSKNFANVMARSDIIEELDQKSDSIVDQSNLYAVQATNFRKQMCIRKYKWHVLSIVLILIIIFFMIVWICGGIRFQYCAKKNNESESK